MREPLELDNILNEFISFEPQQVTEFNKAVEFFKQDIPQIVKELRKMIGNQEASSDGAFLGNRRSFLALCQESINPNITVQDVNEMLIQHILTEEIFLAIFSDAQFLRENNIARELYKMEETFFTGKTKYDTLQSIKHYYDAIKAAASPIADHHEKQTFLKIIYENFYKAYNPKGADRLGIVYTPSQIIKFMIEGTDYLLEKHFGKTLASKNVEILDPATGTGTYITDLIEYLPKQSLQHKFLHELHANEIAILPYYIANLNIEYTYRQRMGDYQPFSNICFVDTLDNLGFSFAGKQGDLFGTLSQENAQRIKRQNERKISVIIGNPPYNANQLNENDNNKNRGYFADAKRQIGGVDGRIRETYIKESTAQKTKVYDMYARFYRWASDRIKRDDGGGILAFVTNRSFIDSRTFDGFRKSVANEYDYIYIMDTRSDVRANPKISGTGHNVFGIQTGVAIAFFIKTKTPIHKKETCQIFYHTLQDETRRLDKLEWLRNNPLKTIDFERIVPDEKGNWLNITDNDFEDLLPLASKDVKGNKQGVEFDKAVFKLFSTGISTNRDEWVIDASPKHLADKMQFFANFYNSSDKQDKDFDTQIKWSRNLKQRFGRGIKEEFDKNRIQKLNYRPYSPAYFYNSELFIDEHGQLKDIFKRDNFVISIKNSTSSKDFFILATDTFYDLHFTGDSQGVPLYRYDENGNRIENITDWGLEQFKLHYEADTHGVTTTHGMTKGDAQSHAMSVTLITKEAIFHYVYAVLHNPAYRKKYEQNLKRDFPRIPFYDNFEQWASWGKTLMDLHIDYEKVNPFGLTIEHRAWVGEPAKKVEQSLIFQNTHNMTSSHAMSEREIKKALIPKTKLKADKINGTIELDEKTIVKGIPAEAWEYKLGNRSALEWVLDQYKESKPSDPTILEKFNTYRFADYKEQVIDLLQRVCTVSVETMKVVNEMNS